MREPNAKGLFRLLNAAHAFINHPLMEDCRIGHTETRPGPSGGDVLRIVLAEEEAAVTWRASVAPSVANSVHAGELEFQGKSDDIR